MTTRTCVSDTAASSGREGSSSDAGLRTMGTCLSYIVEGSVHVAGAGE